MNPKNSRLGPFLKATREQRGLSLRAVERKTGISNPYLSQLEGGKIQQPSPVMLHKLSELYEISYATVLQLANYPVPNQSPAPAPDAGFASRIGAITKEEEEELIEYLHFLRAKRKRRRPR